MSTNEPVLRFKRRKTTHAKRLPAASLSESPDADATDALQDVLRNRKRPRPRESGRKTEASQSQALMPAELPKQSAYKSRFVAQTGEVVHRDDRQMTEYIEASVAEKNRRLYGWPVPRHLEAAVAALAPELKGATHAAPADRMVDVIRAIEPKNSDADADKGYRLAAGMGKLEEVSLGPNEASRNMERSGKERIGRDGKPRRQPKRRNSDDLRRDNMVEAVLREAKLDYFEEDKPAGAAAAGDADNDDAMVEQFRLEFLESMEARQQRKPAPAVAVKGAKEAPRGPKLGGSRSARAAMRLQEEQAAKSKR